MQKEEFTKNLKMGRQQMVGKKRPSRHKGIIKNKYPYPNMIWREFIDPIYADLQDYEDHAPANADKECSPWESQPILPSDLNSKAGLLTKLSPSKAILPMKQFNFMKKTADLTSHLTPLPKTQKQSNFNPKSQSVSLPKANRVYKNEVKTSVFELVNTVEKTKALKPVKRSFSPHKSIANPIFKAKTSSSFKNLQGLKNRQEQSYSLKCISKNIVVYNYCTDQADKCLLNYFRNPFQSPVLKISQQELQGSKELKSNRLILQQI